MRLNLLKNLQYTEIGCDAADSLRYCIENKKGEKDNMKILNIYEDRKALEIRKKMPLISLR